MGSDVQTRLRWDQDALTDCSPEDRVWGWSIRASEVLHHDWTQIADECHWGQGPLETGGNMSGTLKGQEPFT